MSNSLCGEARLVALSTFPVSCLIHFVARLGWLLCWLLGWLLGWLLYREPALRISASLTRLSTENTADHKTENLSFDEIQSLIKQMITITITRLNI